MTQTSSITGKTTGAHPLHEPLMHLFTTGALLPGEQTPQLPEIVVRAGARQTGFMSALAELERWLAGEQITYAIFGSVAVSAWIDQGVSLDFDRPGAHHHVERIPDIDLLVPRVSLATVKRYARAARRSEFPVSIDTFWSECWIDFRPQAAHSYLTHRKLQVPVCTELFAPCRTTLLGQDVTVLDACTLLHMYGVVGVVRRKDAPRITGLTEAITSGTVASRVTEEDCRVFHSFMLTRTCRYPLFLAAKRAWTVLDMLPPGVSQTLKHYVRLPAKGIFRLMNYQGRRGRRC